MANSSNFAGTRSTTEPNSSMFLPRVAPFYSRNFFTVTNDSCAYQGLVPESDTTEHTLALAKKISDVGRVIVAVWRAAAESWRERVGAGACSYGVSVFSIQIGIEYEVFDAFIGLKAVADMATDISARPFVGGCV